MDDGPKGICSDLDADCFDVENKHHCWIYDIKRGYCPWLHQHQMFNGKLVSIREDREPVMIHENGRAEVLRLADLREIKASRLP